MSPEFDYYAISRVLGEGGMGLVYLAHDRRTGLPVAIKVMSKREFDPELQARFLKENRILSALNHRNIVRCFEITESKDGILSIVMEYVDGVDFRAFEGRPFPELLPLMIQALMGLAYLRSQNVVHRDLSSNNIFVTLENQTRVTKILDFGVAKILQQQGVDDDVKTRTGQFLGKFAFASPEHFFPATIDWRSDVYSLGVIFHRLLTKKPPITVARKSNYFDWLVAHQKENSFEVLAPAERAAVAGGAPGRRATDAVEEPGRPPPELRRDPRRARPDSAGPPGRARGRSARPPHASSAGGGKDRLVGGAGVGADSLFAVPVSARRPLHPGHRGGGEPGIRRCVPAEEVARPRCAGVADRALRAFAFSSFAGDSRQPFAVAEHRDARDSLRRESGADGTASSAGISGCHDNGADRGVR